MYKEIRARKKIQPLRLIEKNVKQPLPPSMDEFPALKPIRSTQQHSRADERGEIMGKPKLLNLKQTNPWEKYTETKESQPSNLLEQIIIKQSEKIDTLIQQIGTLMGLLTTLIAQNQK